MWNICRTCMTKEVGMIPIFDNDKSPSIYDMIMAISSLELLPNDTLPPQICITCVETLEMTYNFKEQVIRCNNALLQKQVLSLKLEIVDGNEKEEEEYLSHNHNEYVAMLDSDKKLCMKNVSNDGNHPSTCREIPINNDVFDLSSEYHVKPLNYQLALNDVELPEESSSDVKDVNTHFEEVCTLKSEEVDVEEHGVQFGESGEVIPRQIMLKNKANDVQICSNNEDLSVTTLNESRMEGNNISHNVLLNSNENDKVTSETLEEFMHTSNPNQLTHLDTDNSTPKTNKCKVCGKTFTRSTSLKVHMRRHTGERPFKCQYCNATYVRITELKRHVRLHTGELPPKVYKCEICGKICNAPVYLKRHLATHTDERPFKCQHCDLTFKTTDSLNIHIFRFHTGATKPKSHKCEVCGTTYETLCRLQRHMTCHTDEMPFECQYCNIRFKYVSSLNRHSRTHTGEIKPKPHRCEVCGEYYETASRLKLHIRGHSAVRPFKCQNCNSAYKYSGDLIRHVRMMHPG